MRIDMIGVITSRFDEMLSFYKEVLGFAVKMQLDKFAEFENDGVRFALSTNEVMAAATQEKSYNEVRKGHSFELAFRCETPSDIDREYAALENKGVNMVKEPANMPWGQRTAFFADPDGNIHELFCDL